MAVALRESLTVLSDRFIPWVSDADIEAGQRGLSQIEAELRDTRFGVVVVTAENQHKPWLNFEAGALSKAIPGDAEQRVVPLLVDLNGPAALTGPLSQFQAKVADEEGIQALLRSLAGAAGVDEQVLATRFRDQWPRLDARIAAAKAASGAAGGKPTKSRRDQADVLDEILILVRQIRAESDAGSVASGARANVVSAAAQRRSFRGVAQRAAEQYGMEVLEARRTPDEEGFVVQVAPREGHDPSKKDLDDFTRELRASVPVRYGLKVDWAPF